MQKSFLIAISLFFAINLSAQWKIGPKVGIGTIVKGEENFNVMPMSDHGIYSLAFSNASSVSSAGLMLYNDLGPFYLQMDILGSQYKMNYMIGDYKNINSNSQYYSEQYYIIDGHFTAGAQVKNFKIGVGPSFDFNLDKDSQLTEMYNYENTTKNIEAGFHFQLGYNYKVFHIDLMYTNKFNSIGESFAFGSDDFNINGSANRLNIALGIAF